MKAVMKPALRGGAISGKANLVPTERGQTNMFLILKLLTFNGGRGKKVGLVPL
jgi:hypothetical protein